MARFADTVDLPTPPLPEDIAITFFTCGRIYLVSALLIQFYAKEDFTDEDGMRLGVLEAEFMELNGRYVEELFNLLNPKDNELKNQVINNLKRLNIKYEETTPENDTRTKMHVN